MMKVKLILAATVLLVLGACGKQEARPDLQLRISLPDPASKVTLGDREADVFPTLWQAGDVVSLNGALSNPMSAGFAGGTDAAFSFAAFSGSSPYNLLYPGSAAGTVTLDGKTLPMYGSAAGLDQVFQMHHLCCGICIPLTGDLLLSSLTLSAPGGESVAGVFTPNFSTGALSAVSATPSLTVGFETPVALSETPVPLCLFFAPGTFSEGLLLRAQNAAGDATCTWRFASGNTLSKGKLYLLPETSFSSWNWADGCSLSLEGMSEEIISIEL